MYCSLVEGSLSEVEMLVKFGIRSDLDDSNAWGSFLSVADRSQNTRLVELLLALGKSCSFSLLLLTKNIHF